MQYVPDHKHRYVIDASKPWHLAWWAGQLGVSEDELVEAMLEVGAEANSVAEFLQRTHERELVH